MSVSIHLSGLRLAIVAVLAALVIAVPITVLAVDSFTDVPSGNTYYNDIEALKAKGVTTGCAPNLYCPKDFVTREQMAAFMNRLGALQAGKTPVVNADKVDGYNANDLIRAATLQTEFLKDASATTFWSYNGNITTSVPGILMLTGSAYLYLTGTGSDEVGCTLTSGGVEVVGSNRRVDLSYPDASHDLDDATCANAGMAFVCTPGVHAFGMSFTDLGPSTQIRDTAVSALFVPFGSTGNSFVQLCSTGPEPAAPGPARVPKA